MPHEIEPLVNAKQAAKILGVGRSYIGAVKNAMKADGHPVGIKFQVSKISKWLHDHPEFSSSNHQCRGNKSFLREILEVLESPRHGQREALKAKLRKMV